MPEITKNKVERARVVHRYGTFVINFPNASHVDISCSSSAASEFVTAELSPLTAFLSFFFVSIPSFYLIFFALLLSTLSISKYLSLIGTNKVIRRAIKAMINMKAYFQCPVAPLFSCAASASVSTVAFATYSNTISS